jgi:hypothetical protein
MKKKPHIFCNITGSLSESASKCCRSAPLVSCFLKAVDSASDDGLAQFLPGSGDTKLVSCAGDGLIAYTDLHRIQETSGCVFHCHAGNGLTIVSGKMWPKKGSNIF